MPPALALDRWSRSIVLLHWATAALVLLAFGLALARDALDLEGWDDTLRAAHHAAGLMVFAATLARLVARTLVPRPATEYAPHAWQALAVRGVHAALYVLLAALPVLGYLSASARAGAVHFPGFDGPAAIGRDRDLAESLQAWHQGLAWTLAALVLLHAGAAAWHHFVSRDRVLLRMLAR